LGHSKCGLQAGDAGAEAHDPPRQRRLHALLRDVPEEAYGDAEHGRLVDGRREQVGEPVLELLAPLGRYPVDGALRSPALTARLDRLDIPGRLQLLDGPVEGAG